MLVASVRGAVTGLTSELLEDHIRNHVVDPAHEKDPDGQGRRGSDRSRSNLPELSQMTDLFQLLQQSSAHAWLFVPRPILLGALHGLEPGHSKTVMAAFIVAIRGTKAQAVLLRLSATLSHTALVWIVVLIGLQVGAQLDLTRSEHYFQIGSAILILAIALWTVLGTWRRQRMGGRHSPYG